MKRAIHHEAGHAVIALHYGFNVSKIAVAGRAIRVLIPSSDWLDIATAERRVFLAGGVAAEVMKFGNYDTDGSTKDQEMIRESGGGAIEDYLAEALVILRGNEQLLNRIVNRLGAKWTIARAEASFDLDPDSYDLLDRAELEQLRCRPY